MSNQTENDIKIRKFFFGRMAEDERFEFEQAFAADFGLLEEMRAYENDLIEQYVRGWMNPVDRAEFEANFLNTEKRRQKVEFSRNLIAEVTTEKASAQPSFWSSISAWLTFPRMAATTAFAAVVLVFGSWLLLRNPAVEVGSTVKTNSNLEFDANRVVVAEPTVENRQPEPVNKPVSSPSPTPEPSKSPIQKAPEVAPNPVLALVAGTLRDGGVINELNLPKDARGATFRLNLKTVDYKLFRATITDGNGRAVFTSGNLNASGKIVTLTVPAKNLKSGDYRIKLSGRNPEGEDESVADFQFRVNQ